MTFPEFEIKYIKGPSIPCQENRVLVETKPTKGTMLFTEFTLVMKDVLKTSKVDNSWEVYQYQTLDDTSKNLFIIDVGDSDTDMDPTKVLKMFQTDSTIPGTRGMNSYDDCMKAEGSVMPSVVPIPEAQNRFTFA